MRRFVTLWALYTVVVFASVFLTLVSIAALRPCASDDGVNCHWSAQERGNGAGRSFIAIGWPGHDRAVFTVYY